MDTAIRVRALILAFFKKFETLFVYLFKYSLGFFVFSKINTYFAEMGTYCVKLDRAVFVVGAAALTMLMPDSLTFLLMWAFISAHLFFFSFEFSIIASLALLCLILFYIRVFPKESWLIIMLLVCLKLKIPFFVPLFAGLYFGIGAIGSFAIAPLLVTFMDAMPEFAKIASAPKGIDIFALPLTFASNLELFFDTITSEPAFIYIAIVFGVATLAVNLLKTMPINFAHEIGLIAGSIVLFFGTLIASSKVSLPFSVAFATPSIVFSLLLAFICKIFTTALDYSKIEHLNFEDNDYLYYVKAVPKIKSKKEVEENEERVEKTEKIEKPTRTARVD